jgi:hypothetical protein
MKINLQYHGKSKKNVGNVENRKLSENSSQFSTCKETFKIPLTQLRHMVGTSSRKQAKVSSLELLS